MWLEETVPVHLAVVSLKPTSQLCRSKCVQHRATAEYNRAADDVDDEYDDGGEENRFEPSIFLRQKHVPN
jgi:hypothetical protein